MSNKERGDSFAKRVGEFLEREGHSVSREYAVDIGFHSVHKRSHRFDFGNGSLLVECKYYDWTETGNNPSGKISTLNEAMMYFDAAPKSFRKMLFVSRTKNKGVRNPETLAEHYVRLHSHFIPDDVEVWEFDDDTLVAKRIGGV